MERTIEDSDIEYQRTQTYENGQKLPEPREVIEFREEGALAMLLMNDVVFLNDHWWEEKWPDDARAVASLNVNCNDVFAWGCADAEEMPFREIENVYRMWRKDPTWGPAVWCMIRRKQMPQKPVENRIRSAGIWDLDKLGLPANWQDAEVTAFFNSLKPQPKPTAQLDN